MGEVCYYGNMAELYKSKRARFSKGEQKKFILEAKEELGLTWEGLADILGISSRNLLDWKNEKFSLLLGAVKTIFRKTHRKISKISRYWTNIGM